MSIIYRSDLSSPMTWDQLDENFRTVESIADETTRQAAIASEFAFEAKQASDESQQSARDSERWSEEAQAKAGAFSTVEKGLLATSDGQLFGVLSEDKDDVLDIYQNDGGIAIYTGKSTASDEAVREIQGVAGYFETTPDRNDVMAGFMDAARRLGMDLDFAGKLNLGNFKDVVGHILALEAKTAEERVDRSGNKISILDQSDAVAVALANDGSLINKGRNILEEIDAIKSGAANSKWITPSENIYTGGDSLSDNSYQVFLRQMLPDRNIVVESLPGKRSGQIARLQGGVAPMITISDNKIPASGSVQVSVDVPFLRNSIQITGHLYGVYGVLSAVDDVHFFTRSQSGSVVEIDTVTPFIKSVVDYDYAYRTAIFWTGNNDTDDTYRAQVDGNATRMVEYLRPQDKRFIIIGMAIADYPDRHKGTPYYTDTMALHKKWRERWPDNFIDITPILQRHYDPNNPTDVQNVLDGCTPSSLRQPNDKVHLNEAGLLIVAEAIFSHLMLRGW